MAAFFVSSVRVKDPQKFQDYSAKAAQTFVPFGGKLVMRGKAQTALVGDSDHQAVGIVSFPDIDALDGWYRSAEYQQLIPLRDAAADMTLIAYSEPA